MESPPWTALAALACAALFTAAWAAAAGRLGLTDEPRGPGRRRKLQERPVPAVGGLALLSSFAAVALLSAGLAAGAPSGAGQIWQRPASWCEPRLALAGLLAAFLTGLVDDRVRDGLRPRTKLLLQTAAALPLALDAARAVPGAVAALAVLCAVELGVLVAVNAFNVYDNSDGVAASLGALALLPAAPVAGWALLGFLPFNLVAPPAVRAGRQPAREPGRRPAPAAYLGDAGSHLVGFSMVLVPAAWPLFCVPLCDAARVAWARWRAGQPPWAGDRRHLAHRFQELGWPPLAVCAAATALSLPAAVLEPGPGVAASALLYALAVALTARRAPRAP